MAEEIYVRNKETAFVNIGNKFVYEVTVFCHYKNYFSIIDRKYFSSNVEISNIVPHFFRDPHTEICAEIYSAPIYWLLENDFVKYVKPDKKVIINKIKTKKSGKSKTTIGKRGSWLADGETDSP